MATPQIHADAGLLRVTGDLTFATVPGLVQEVSWASGVQTVDLSRVQKTDSAAVALLLEWSRQARAHGGLRLEAIPERLRQLIEVHGVETLFQRTSA
ncbi:MAG TPA: STAS domain-containing protein [Acidiferrobacteraceae bacterium]|nr:STAS domain-containing protein [Acidiferrobacteraceae bacterium]